jgi:hypothetical protein
MATVFVSCGQYTDEEKALGKRICEIVRLSKHEPYFAETQSNLKGLHENILSKLLECSGFITVMHPRGEVHISSTAHHIRGSVWVEQEIAIAAFIAYALKRNIQVAAFIHETVRREGIRDLLHLNPESFRTEEEIIEKLPGILDAWRLEENATVTSLVVKDELKAFGPHNYFYRNNNTEGPYCPFCWQKDEKEVLLPASKDSMSGHGRQCRVCKEIFVEGPSKVEEEDSAPRFIRDFPRY